MAIQRIVCFKFKESATDLDRRSHMDDLAALKTLIPQMASYTAGFGLSGDFGSSPKYDTLHYMTFASMEDVNIYFEHEAHKRFVENHKTSWDDVLVLNANIAE